MSMTRTCRCGRDNWVVIHYKHNHSYFESPQGAMHWSEWSKIECKKCGHVFSSKAQYVDQLPMIEGGCIYMIGGKKDGENGDRI